MIIRTVTPLIPLNMKFEYNYPLIQKIEVKGVLSSSDSKYLSKQISYFPNSFSAKI